MAHLMHTEEACIALGGLARQFEFARESVFSPSATRRIGTPESGQGTYTMEENVRVAHFKWAIWFGARAKRGVVHDS